MSKQRSASKAPIGTRRRLSPRAECWTERAGGVALVGAALIIGYVWGSTDGPSYSNGPPPAAPRIDLGKEGTYLSIGDSYSAGEGLSPYELETVDVPHGDRCHRSEQLTFPRLLRFEHRTTQIFRACSGAVAKNVFEAVQDHSGTLNHLGLQIEPETIVDDITLVTLTMGGNDIDFADVLVRCFKRRTCIDDPYGGAETLDQWVNEQFEPLGPALQALYQGVRDRVPPDVPVVVIGYPPLFPERAPGFFDQAPAGCKAFLTSWNASEREAIRGYGVELNAIIQDGATKAGIDYVDIHSHFAQHEPCGTEGGWVRFVGSAGPRDGWFHPNKTGQEMIARILSCYFVTRDMPEEIQDVEMSSCVANVYPGTA